MKKEKKDFCEKHGITEKQFSGEEHIGDSLYLGSVTSLPENFNPTVGGYLYLSSVTSLPENFNPTVGGDLYLRSVTSLPENFNPTVGGDLYLRSVTDGSNVKQRKLETNIVKWEEKYILIDGIFTKIVSKKGNIYVVKKLNSLKEFYLVTDGKFTHSHGDTLKEAKEDFKFKVMSEKLKKYPITKDTIITVPYYRIITGSCKLGVADWMGKNFSEKERTKILDKGIKAIELLPILEKTNAYGLERFKKLITF
jgi:hypothetical protein